MGIPLGWYSLKSSHVVGKFKNFPGNAFLSYGFAKPGNESLRPRMAPERLGFKRKL